MSTQLTNGNTAEGKTASGISPIVPLGISVATLPSIWKNRPRGVPQAGLWLQHRDTRGRLTQTWEQPLSSEAKNSAELLTVTIDKPLTEGTLEVYLQNGSKNNVYYWGLETTKNVANLIDKNVGVVAYKPNSGARMSGCPDGYLPNGQGQCCNPFNGDCVNEGGDTPPPPPPPNPTTPPPVPQGCPSGYLPNGQGMCCRPGSNDCVSEGTGNTPPPPITTPPSVPQGCPSGYLPNGQGMCCRPGTNDCVSEGSGETPPVTAQTYSGEWRCTAGLLPTSGGNCLNLSTGDVIAPVFAVNPQDPGPFPNECPVGQRVIISIDGDGTEHKSCAGNGELGTVVVVGQRLPPVIPITPYPTTVYIPVVIISGTGGGNPGTGGGTGGPGDGKTDPSDDKNPVRCKQCKQSQLNKLDADLSDAETNFYLNCAACLGFTSGAYDIGQKAGRWITGTDEGGISGSLMLSLLVALPCLYQMNFNYQKQIIKAYEEYYDNINDKCSQYCK